MPVVLSSHRYGKSRVRLVKVERQSSRHHLFDLTIEILLEGEFSPSYTIGDNSSVVPTDTMKNTVYALAGQGPIGCAEEFGQRLAALFLERFAHVERVRLKIEEGEWQRIEVDGREHDHAFTGGDTERRTVRIEAARDGSILHAGIIGLVVLKTAQSGFEGYIHDDFTTLPETKDRLFGTSIRAEWRYTGSQLAFDGLFHGIRQTLLAVFADHDSKGVQHTLYAMGERALEQFPEISDITIRMPNRHCLLVDLTRFGMTNPNEVFVPTDEPHGLIEASLSRSI